LAFPGPKARKKTVDKSFRYDRINWLKAIQGLIAVIVRPSEREKRWKLPPKPAKASPVQPGTTGTPHPRYWMN
jgi:hypothetical protein